MNIKPLLFAALTATLPPIANASLSWSIESSYGFDEHVSNREDEIPRVYIPDNGWVEVEFPDYDTESWQELEVASAHSVSLNAKLNYDISLSARWTLNIIAGLEYGHSYSRYYAEGWAYFHGFNPTPDNENPFLNGSGEFEIDSDTWTPELGIGLKYRIGSRLSALVELAGGYSFTSADDYNFFDQIKQKIGAHNPDVGTALPRWDFYSDNDLDTARFRGGLGLAYDISPGHAIYMRYDIMFYDEIILRNTIITEAGADIYHLPIRDRYTQRIVIGFQSEF